ncbi:MAG: histidine kinase [Crocinitomicaceae bacterium]
MTRPFIIALVYLLFGLCWIYFSDSIVFNFTDDPQQIHHIQNIKGYVFIFISTLLIFVLIQALYNRLIKQQKNLNNKNRQLSLILNNTTEIIGLTRYLDGQFIFININRAGQEVHKKNNIPLDHYLNQELKSYYIKNTNRTTEEAREIEAYYKKSLNENCSVNFTTSFEFGKGDLRTVETMLSPILNDQGPNYVLYVSRDISEIRKKALELRESREQLLQAQRIGKLGNWELLIENQKISWSPMMADIFDWDPTLAPPALEYLENMIFEQDLPGYRQLLEKAILNNHAFDIDLRIKTGKGNIKYIRTICMPVKEKGEVVKLIGTTQDITDKIQMHQQKTKNILEAIEKERAHIAREIHDSLTQHLSIVSLNLKNLSTDLPEIKSLDKFEKIQGFLNTAIEESRSIAHRIMPQSIKKFGLIVSIEELIESLAGNDTAKIVFEFDKEFRLESEIELQLFRIVQEAFNNILRHSKAKNVVIQLTFYELLQLTIKDDGIGFSLDEKLLPDDTVGLHTMKYRADQIGASLLIESEKNKGTTIYIELNKPPIKKTI